jgi:hypothetical protein
MKKQEAPFSQTPSLGVIATQCRITQSQREQYNANNLAPAASTRAMSEVTPVEQRARILSATVPLITLDSKENNVVTKEYTLTSILTMLPCHMLKQACLSSSVSRHLTVRLPTPRIPQNRPPCTRKVSLSKRTLSQTVVHYEYTCMDCYMVYSFDTQPQERCKGDLLSDRGRGYKQVAVNHILSVAVNNFVFDKYATYQTLNGLAFMPKTTYHRTHHMRLPSNHIVCYCFLHL